MKVYKKNVFYGTKVTTSFRGDNSIVKFSASRIEYDSIFIQVSNGFYVELSDLQACSLPKETAIKMVKKYKTYPTEDKEVCVCNLKQCYKIDNNNANEEIDIADIYYKPAFTV